MVECKLKPVEFESVIGSVTKRRTGEGRVVLLDEEMRCQTHRQIQESPSDWESNRWWIARGLL